MPDDIFKVFWKEYPRKVGKAAAEKSWKKIKMSEDLFKKIMKSLSDYKRIEWDLNEPRYIPHASTWLNQARYEDELEENMYSKPTVKIEW